MSSIVFFDTEVSEESKRLLDLGAVKEDQTPFHSGILAEFLDFAGDAAFLCGHNIFAHDLNYVRQDLEADGKEHCYIDTLTLSPMFFPLKQYHSLGKTEKLDTEEENNPLSDAIKARDLFYEEVTAFQALPRRMKVILYALLCRHEQFQSFFRYLDFSDSQYPKTAILTTFDGKICSNCELDMLIKTYPVELAYCLSLIREENKNSDLCPWVIKNYPNARYVMQQLRGVPCPKGCRYCRQQHDIHTALLDYFDYSQFRTYEGEALQEKAVQHAVDGHSLLAIFPTGGGKSLTFQLPALMAGAAVCGLTVVISPLQSLMKDQVDGLEKKGISQAVTINGLLNPLERSEAIRRIQDCSASILYISPESLRSRTIEKLLTDRNVVRFVIDEAHCFSAWGQDFRVDYLYIGKFMQKLAKKKGLSAPIPVSCFTATAKQKVISDIREYFRQTLGLELSLFSTNATRKNLRYEVLFRETDEKKFATLRSLIEAKQCPTIVYASRTKRAEQLAAKLTKDGYPALCFHGQMDSAKKIENQNAFMQGEANIIVATSAFGMGVDKDNVRLVVHYNISNSLEDYVQEAGRAGRNPELTAECYVLFNDEDLNKHFVMLSQTKLSMDEIQQVWSAIKRLSRNRPLVVRSALEIAREAGWNENKDIETKVKAAVAALENAGYVTRENNVPHIYANGILPHSMMEASNEIQQAPNMTPAEKRLALATMSRLYSSKYQNRKNKDYSLAFQDDAENRVDYIADVIGVEHRDLVNVIEELRSIGVLADSQDMTAHIDQSDKQTRSETMLAKSAALERYLIDSLPESGLFTFKELNNAALQAGIKSATVKAVKNLLNYWEACKYIEKIPRGYQQYQITRLFDPAEMRKAFEQRLDISHLIMAELYSRVTETTFSATVNFSVKELLDAYNLHARNSLITQDYRATKDDIEAALLYLQRINAMDLDGGFFVFYQAMQIQRVEMNNKIQYKKSDYRKLDEFYQQRIQQIHIVGKYAHLMTENYEAAQRFVQDYFALEYNQFIKKYFDGDEHINIGLTQSKYRELFGELSAMQQEIIQDDSSQYIVVAAGPGSGKTRLLVHKLASLLILENVKSDQLLMLTFSRAAASEFKQRLIQLIGDTAYFVEVNTFHSYSFDLLGRVGTLEESDDVVKRAAAMIRQGEVDIGRITKTVLVIDEAQDMDAYEFSLVTALMEANPQMRVIAVGDDDQNIYEFRGSNSAYLRSLVTDYDARQYELLENFRSAPEIVDLANHFVKKIQVRMKKQANLQAVKRVSGRCVITQFQTNNLESATVRMLHQNHTGGNCCVLTARNEEAFRIVAELKSLGHRARLIQDLSGFRLSDLLEVRSFLHNLGEPDEMPLITDDRWNYALEKLKKDYAASSCLPEVLKLFNEFDSINKRRFRSDLEQYILETQFEDLISSPEETILVSTIHKAKGREFETVYMNLNHYEIRDDEQRHALYVGMTRAKKELFINENSHLFDDVKNTGVELRQDLTEYPGDREMLLSLSHEDIYLHFCLGRQDSIKKLHSGMALRVTGDCMVADFGRYKNPVLRFSRKMKDRLKALYNAGYRISRAEVRFLVFWHPKDEPEKEGLLVLPDLYLKK
ncbi:MAG: RecQ family ATP-dependent DNA helicase [Oscillospiraceae bacterium]|nr:RecQ family ATP-dependent DNA helicase [Oscillospiraceae bacterium]